MSICTLCPRRCGVDRNIQKGACGVGSEILLARAALHQWEEPCISGTNGAGTVFFSGCNLRCVFCQNEKISHGAFGFPVSVERLREICLDLVAQGAHNIDLVTPTHYADRVAELLRQPLPVPVVYNCGGYEGLEALQALRGKVDIYLPDLKYIEDETARKLSAAPDYFTHAIRAIDEMVQQTGECRFDEEGLMKRGVIIRHMVLPGHVKQSMRIIDYVAERYGNRVMMSLMGQYTPCAKAAQYPPLDRKLTRREYDRAVAHFLDAGFDKGYVQDWGSASGKFIPAFNGEGVL